MEPDAADNTAGEYARLLPAVLFSETRDGRPVPRRSPGFLDKFLRVFERVWTARGVGDKESLAEILDVLPELFHPGFSYDFKEEALNEWLDWLAGWLDLTPMPEWSTDKYRRVLTRIAPLYRMRGTREGLQSLLRLFFERPFHVLDDVRVPVYRVGRTSRLGGRGAVGGFPSDYFIVVLRIHMNEKHRMRDLARKIRIIVDREKPVQSKYSLVFQIHGAERGFKVAFSRLGVDSIVIRREEHHGRGK